MNEHLLICTDLDRTLIPNGSQPESAGARQRFTHLVGNKKVTLVYVSGRHRELIEEAMRDYDLPVPDFILADVGTTIYQLDSRNNWQACSDWQAELSAHWGNLSHDDIHLLLKDIEGLSLQEAAKQNRFKISYYADLTMNAEGMVAVARERLQSAGIPANLIWSIDEQLHRGLLDILPPNATKHHAIEFLIKREDFTLAETVFCGDSGNDMEVLVSPIPAVLVANSTPEVQNQAIQEAKGKGTLDNLYIAHGDFFGMNGNYSAGILEGIAHYHPEIVALVEFEKECHD